MKETIKKLESIKLFLMAHPDYVMEEGHAEIHDRVESLEEAITELQNIDDLHGVSGAEVEAGVWLTGHDEQTVAQMLKDWKSCR